MKKSGIKALALLSGGLDSILAVRLIQEQNITVEGLSFTSIFFLNKNVDLVAEKLNIVLHKVDFTDDILNLLDNPKYGFGKNLNPCIDCHLLMLKRAGELLPLYGADFIITGEVVGERPKSQNYHALQLIARRSGFEGLILRPLSAKALPPTDPEKNGLVDREKLLGITGRTRNKQIALAEKWGIDYFPQPAGGCLLTVPRFADRLHLNLQLKKVNRIDLELLKYGRHFLSRDNIRILVGRDQEDNRRLLETVDEQYFIFELQGLPGPVTVLCSAEPPEDLLITAARLTAHYSRHKQEESLAVRYYRKNSPEKVINVKACSSEELGLKFI